jgi:hypothetical protein
MSKALVAFIVIPELAVSAFSQSSGRTGDGQPDIQGVRSNASIIPLDRPKELEGKQFFTPEEFKERVNEL